MPDEIQEIEDVDTTQDEDEISALFKGRLKEEPPAEEPPEKEPPKREPAKEEPVKEEPAKEEPPKEDKPPEPDPEERIQREVEERLTKERQKIAEGVLRDERKRQDNALRKLRDLEAMEGKSYDQIVAERRAAKIEHAKEKFAMDDQEAEVYVREREENARLKAEREADRQAREEAEMASAYTAAKSSYFDNPKVTPSDKAAARKYAAEIDAFSGHGKILKWEVAAAQIIGQKHSEIVADLEKVWEQKFLRNQNTPDKKAQPVAAGPSGSSTPSVTPQQYTLGRKLGLSDKEIREAYASQKRK